MHEQNHGLQPSSAAIALIKQFEGYSSESYPDPGTGAEPFTIGYGTTTIDGKPFGLGVECTREEAEEWLILEIEEKILPTLLRVVNVPLTQQEFDALVVFCYNVGMGAFSRSTLLILLNQGKYDEAAEQFMRWNKAGGKIMRGLTRRRQAEKDLFLS